MCLDIVTSRCLVFAVFENIDPSSSFFSFALIFVQ